MKKFFLIPLMTLMCSVMAFAVDITSRSELQSFLTAEGTASGVIAANLDLTAEGAHFLVAGTKELTINEGVTLSLKSAYNEQEEEQPNGYDGHGFCFYVQDGAKFTVKGNGTIAADRSVIFVEEGGELTIGESSKASQLNVTTSVSNVKQRIVVAKGDASIYNANITGRSGVFWCKGKLLIDGGTYLGKSSASDNVQPLADQYTYAVNGMGTSVVLRNATIKGVHGAVTSAYGGRVDIDNCNVMASSKFSDSGKASSYYGIYLATYGICTVRNSKISGGNFATWIGNDDSQHTFGLLYLYENCYLGGANKDKSYPMMQKKGAYDEDILFPVTIDKESDWYKIAETGTHKDWKTLVHKMPLLSGIEYQEVTETIDGITFYVKTVSTTPAEKQESASTDPAATIPWQQETTWAGDVPADDDAVTIPEGKVVVIKNDEATTDVAAAQVNIQGEGASLTVEEGTSLEIGQSLNITPGAKLVVDAGAMVTVGAGGVVAADDDAIEVKMTEGKTGIFMIAPTVKENTHPMAKVELHSKAYKRGENDYVWQRFGLPGYIQGVKRSDMEYDHVTYPTSVKKVVNQNWANMENDDEFIPFKCYALTTNNPSSGAIYSFTCPLVGNGNAELELTDNWNYYANSYTAPINIAQMISDFAASYPNVSATVYLYNPENDWWFEINSATPFLHPTWPKTIEPMQAFIFQRLNDGANPEINYQKQIWNPIMESGASLAPAREKVAPFGTAVIEITAADGSKDNVSLIAGNQFSAGFDNAYDATKYMNDASFNLFADANNEKMSIVASDDLAGTTLSMTTKGQTSFTMTISNVNDMNYAIRDMLTGTEIAIEEGATYMFSVPANANVENRFEIVAIAKVPTAIENIETTAAAKGIYTITGQFVGNDYHSLPNGIYVVDGKKIVK